MQSTTDPARLESAIQQFRTVAGLAACRAAIDRDAFKLARQRVFYAPHQGVAEIQDAVVLSGEWFVIAGALALCDAFAQTPFPPRSAYHFGLPSPEMIDLIHPQPRGPAIPRGFLLGGCPNYCHWLMDYLPRLALLRGDWPILVNADLKPFQRESLTLLGINSDRLLPLDYPGAYAVERLCFPSLNSSWCVLPIPFRTDILTWLRTKFACLMSPQAGRRIFISRESARSPGQRRLENAEEIEGIARQHGFEIVACETLPFREQVRLFSETSVAAGAHGAGFTNVVFSPPGCRIIELAGPRLARDSSRGSMAFHHLAKTMNHDFVRCIGRAGETPIEHDHLVNETFAIDPAEFTRVIGQR